MKFNRRSFLSVLGLSTVGATVGAPTLKETPPPKAPQVKSNCAYVTTVVGHDWHEITHCLNKPLICAVAGDRQGRVIRAELEPLSLSACRLRVPAPTRVFSWLRRKTDQSYSVVVYVPLSE